IAQQGAEHLARRTAEIIGRDLAQQPPIMMRQLTAMRRYDASQRLGGLSGTPCLVVSAIQDPIAMPKYWHRLSQMIPGSNYVEIPDASHGVTIQMPARVNDMLRLHLDRAEAIWAARLRSI